MFQKYLAEAAKIVAEKKASEYDKYGLKLDDIIFKEESTKAKKLKLQKRWIQYTNELLDNIYIQNTCYNINGTQIEQTKDVIESPKSLY